MKRFQWIGLVTALLALPAAAAPVFTELVPLARPGPWSGVSGLAGFAGRLWLVNSVKFANHNSADVYSYDPAARTVRYERHLFSQDAGQPAVAGGRLYWPFEDARFSVGQGEYMVTDGERWRWRTLGDGEAFHVHAMAQVGETLYAATSAWRAALQRSDDDGRTWHVLYDHVTPAGRVSRFTDLAVLDATLYAGLASFTQPGVKLFKLLGEVPAPVTGWPPGQAVRALTTYRKWLYAVNVDRGQTTVWRTNGAKVEPITELDGFDIRAFAAGGEGLFAVSAGRGRGALWRSVDGVRWRIVQRFADAEPLAVGVFAGQVFVGTQGPGTRGTLWGPATRPVAIDPGQVRPLPPASAVAPEPATELDADLTALDAMLAGVRDLKDYRARLEPLLTRLAQQRSTGMGVELSKRLSGRYPATVLPVIGGALEVSVDKLNKWYLLRAVAADGYGQVPLSLLSAPWTVPANRAEKYFEPGPAAAWAIAEIGQNDPDTIAALIARLGAPDQPDWLNGDWVGALSVITGQRFGYDFDAWRSWWAEQRP